MPRTGGERVVVWYPWANKVSSEVSQSKFWQLPARQGLTWTTIPAGSLNTFAVIGRVRLQDPEPPFRWHKLDVTRGGKHPTDRHMN